MAILGTNIIIINKKALIPLFFEKSGRSTGIFYYFGLAEEPFLAGAVLWLSQGVMAGLCATAAVHHRFVVGSIFGDLNELVSRAVRER